MSQQRCPRESGLPLIAAFLGTLGALLLVLVVIDRRRMRRIEADRPTTDE